MWAFQDIFAAVPIYSTPFKAGPQTPIAYGNGTLGGCIRCRISKTCRTLPTAYSALGAHLIALWVWTLCSSVWFDVVTEKSQVSVISNA